MGDTRLPKCMFGELLAGSAGCVGGAGMKSEWGVSWTTSELSVSTPTSEKWTTAAQDEGECRKTAEQGVERFI